MWQSRIFGLIVFGLFTNQVNAQASSTNDVRLFLSHFRDAPIASSPYVEGGAAYADAVRFSTLGIEAKVGVPVTSTFHLGAELALMNRRFNAAWEGDYEDGSGFADPIVYGRYDFLREGELSVSLGGIVTLPIGSEKIGGGEGVDYGIFAAGRYRLDDIFSLIGTAGIEESLVPIGVVETGRQSDGVLGLGAIVNAFRQLNVIGEFQYKTASDFRAALGGADYRISDAARLRGSLFVGLGYPTPDIGVQGSFLFAFGR